MPKGKAVELSSAAATAQLANWPQKGSGVVLIMESFIPQREQLPHTSVHTNKAPAENQKNQ